MKTWSALVKTDLKLILHRPENVISTVLYGIMVLVIVHFSLPSGRSSSVIMGTSALWLAIILSSILGLPRLQHHPDAVGFLPQLLTGRISPGGYYWAKLCSGFLITGFTALVLYPMAVLLFHFPLGMDVLDGLGIYLLGAIGVAVVLTLASALTVGREAWLLPLLVFPLLIPVVLSGTQLMSSVVGHENNFPWAWLHLLIAYNLLLLLGGWFLSEFLWEELPE